MAYELPSPDERKILFRLLQQQSAYTTWKFIGEYFSQLIALIRELKPIASFTDPYSHQQSDALSDSDIRLAIECEAAFHQALTKLARGDRSVFKWEGYGSGSGYFCEASRVLNVWNTNLGRLNEVIPLAETEYWPEFERTLDICTTAWGKNGGYALESRFLDKPAKIEDMADLREQAYGEISAYRLLRDAGLPLPEVPKPSTQVLLKTGDPIPVYGIWEPVQADLSPGFLGMFKKPIDADKAPLDGCMNYLHAGSRAPTIGFEGDGPRGEGRPTVWKLLWEDDRYGPRSIPPEEADYVFYVPAVPVPRHPERVDEPPLVMAFTGDRAPRSGRWLVKGDPIGSAIVRAGETLPAYKNREVEWVWLGTTPMSI